MELTRGWLETRLRALVDLFTYALVLTSVSLAISLFLGVATGGGAVRAKVFLFVIGWVMVGYATVLLWPSRPPIDGDDEEGAREKGSSLPARDASRFQGIVRKTPPARWIQLPPPQHRIPLRSQLFFGGLCILATSYVMETVFNVA